jgi:hypothetical protein
MTESALLSQLDRAIRVALGGTTLASMIADVESRLARSRTLQMTWASVPLTTYSGLPEDIRSSWVFVLRGGISTGAERHPNSRQRMISYRGTGDLQTWEDGRWRRNPLVSGAGAPASLSIPPNVWHRPVIPAGMDWTVISFHTAPDDELIEERPIDDDHPDRGTAESQLYAGRAQR